LTIFALLCALAGAPLGSVRAQSAAPAARAADDAAGSDLDKGLSVAVGLGPGIGNRRVEMPTRSGERRLETRVFPAVDLGVRAQAPLRWGFSLTAQARYQTSLGLTATDLPADRDATRAAPLRAHYLDLGLAPGYRFGRLPDAVVLRLFVGWAFHGLRSVVRVGVPAYTLSGPVLRPELTVPLARGRIAFRIGPELLVLTGVSGSLRNIGYSAVPNAAWAVEGAIDVRITARVYLAAAYRESHAMLGSAWGADMTDVERFTSVQAVLRY
jgi:hypothetical protein